MKNLTHILYVDDDDDILEIVKLALQLAPGLKVSCCGSGPAALTEIPILQPDLVLLDVMMPQMDGPAMFAELRKFSTVPVIFLTARMQERQVDEYQALGAIGVLPKPFDPILLHSQVLEIWKTSECSSGSV
jgi:two-component system OmpR family response regulator